MPDIASLHKERKQIQNLLRANTDCEELICFDYTITNSVRTSASIKLVGCPFENYEAEADRLLLILKDSLNYICEIKDLHFQFVNKGVYKSKKYYKCQ